MHILSKMRFLNAKHVLNMCLRYVEFMWKDHSMAILYSQSILRGNMIMQIKFKAISRPWRCCYDEPRVVHCVSHWLSKSLLSRTGLIHDKTGVRPTSTGNGE